MSYYPDRHHPVYFLLDALRAAMVNATFVKDDRTMGCWGMYFPDYAKYLVWLIDNRLPHERAKEDPAALALLDRGDTLVCHAQLPDYQRIGGHWLPLAATPGYRAMPDVLKTFDAAFIGYVRDRGRKDALLDAAAVCQLQIADTLFGDDAVRFYNQARIGVNVPSHYGSGYDYDLNMRLFEVAACGIGLVTQHTDALTDLGFIPLHNCIAYGRGLTLHNAIELALQPEYADIGRRAAQLIADQHTYAQRAQTVQQWLTE